jgi:hypothetical protein
VYFEGVLSVAVLCCHLLLFGNSMMGLDCLLAGVANALIKQAEDRGYSNTIPLGTLHHQGRVQGSI